MNLFLQNIDNVLLLKAEKGGYKTFVMEIKGQRVYSKLKYESGVHRVQRVPLTETQGRVHTSTATVAIMPEVHLSSGVIFDEALYLCCRMLFPG